MSRIGKKILLLPEKVKTEYRDHEIWVKGPKGELNRSISPMVDITISGHEIEVKRKNETREARSVHGLTRTLLSNMIKGVTEGFEKRLDIIGLGYKAQVQGETLHISLGFVSPVQVNLPKGVQAKVEANTKIVLSSANREILGDFAAKIRQLRPPEPYKGTGIRYEGEVIVKKVGKTTGATASA